MRRFLRSCPGPWSSPGGCEVVMGFTGRFWVDTEKNCGFKESGKLDE